MSERTETNSTKMISYNYMTCIQSENVKFQLYIFLQKKKKDELFWKKIKLYQNI